MRSRKRKADDKWVEEEKEQAEQAVQESEQQLDEAKGLAQQSSKVSRKFLFHKQRNMFAEGLRLIIKEAHR